MSTLLSTDMVIDRSSTRRHAPPGGRTTINLGSDPDPPAPVRRQAAAQAPAPAPAPLQPPAPPAESKPFTNMAQVRGLKIGVVVAEGSPLVQATISALSDAGYGNATTYEVNDPLQLPFAAQYLIANAGVSAVIALGTFTESHWCSKEVAQTVMQALLTLGLERGVPIVNGLSFQRPTAGSVPSLARQYVAGAVNLARLKGGQPGQSAPAESPANSVRSSTSISTAFPEKGGSGVFAEAPKNLPTDIKSLLTGLKESLKRRGAVGIFGLARKFRIADDNGDKTLDNEEFRKCMKECAVGWNEGQVQQVFEFFDDDGSGSISYDEFLLALRGELSQRRGQLVLAAFALMDKDKSGTVDINDLRNRFDASQQPEVMQGKKSQDQVLEEFLHNFEAVGGGTRDGKVTPEEWCRYYSLLSSSIDEDDYFELVIRNAWRMSGGSGWSANSTCRRVLVTHADGTQTVEEVKNDLGIKPGDRDAMLNRLKEQGVDAVGIDLFGSMDSTTPASNTRHQFASSSSGQPSPAARTRQAPGGNSNLVLG